MNFLTRRHRQNEIQRAVKPLVTSIFLAIYVFSASQSIAAEKVSVVLGDNASQLETLAANELVNLFEKLFDAQVSIIQNEQPDQDARLIYVGNPTSNKAIADRVDKWPEMSDQGIFLRSLSNGPRTDIVVGGGSDVATLWAVYELGHQLGVRYLLRDDIYPTSTGIQRLNGIDVVSEPNLRDRTWRTKNKFAFGPESWPLAQHQNFLKQLAKLKFNRIVFQIQPWHPFVHYEFGGVKKQIAMLGNGERYPIPRDAPGSTGLGAITEFQNPDFADATNYEEMISQGISHLQGIMDQAHRLGMSAEISISPLEFTREFEPFLPNAATVPGSKNRLISPGGQQKQDDSKLKGLVTAKIRAYIETYPNIDALHLTLPANSNWGSDFEDAWTKLQSRLETSTKIEELLQQASSRAPTANGEPGIRSLKGSVVALSFLNELLDDDQLLQRPGGKKVELIFQSMDPVLQWILPELIPRGASARQLVEATARPVFQSPEYLKKPTSNQTSNSLVISLADGDGGILPQSATRRLEDLVSQIHRNRWQGFSTSYSMLAELDPAVYYLSRTAWEPKLSARESHDDLFRTITGKQSISDRLWLGFGHIEKATELIDQHGLDFDFPDSDLLMKHYQPGPMPDWWDEVNQEYSAASVELYRSHSGADIRARNLLYYWAKRSEYVVSYLACVTSLRNSANAKTDGNLNLAIEQMETAVEEMYNAIDTLGDIALDASDRGLIAVLNTHAYQPLVAAYEQLLEEE